MALQGVPRGPEGDFAMSFEEIAEIEGVSKQAVAQAYQKALRKLRRYPAVLDRMRGLAVELRRNAQVDHRMQPERSDTWL